MSMRHLITLPLLLALTLSAAANPGDAPRIANPDTPRDGADHVLLDELWRVGGDDGDLLLGMITQVRQDRGGDLYVMDAQLSCVHVITPDGTHRRTLFGEGEGPGEIRGPRDIILLDDGRVGAVQEQPGKLVFVDRQGTPAGQLQIGGDGAGHGGFCQTFSAFTDGQQILMAGFVQKPGSAPGHLQQTSFLSGLDADGRRAVQFAQTVNDIALADFTFDESRHLSPFWWNAAVAPDGRVYVAPDPLRYEIQVHRPDGSLERVIQRRFEPLPRTRAEKDRFVEVVQAIYHGAPMRIGVEPLDHEPTVASMHRGLRIHDDGSLWVLTSRGLRQPAGGAMLAFDVFDREGVFVRQVHVHGPWNSSHDTVFFLDDDHAVVVTGFADAMLTQFTGGNLDLELEGEAEGMAVIYCRVTPR